MTARTSPSSSFRWALRVVGSKSFLEPKSLVLLVVPISAISSVLSSNAADLETHLIWLLANLIAFGVVTAPVLALRRVWQQRFEFKSLPVTLVLLISTLVSFSKVYLTLAAVNLFIAGAISDSDMASRLLTGTISGVFALLLASLSLATLGRFQFERAVLLSAKVLSSTNIVRGTEAKQIQALAKAIASMRLRLRSGKASATPKFEMAILRELLDKYVRPLSSSLYGELDQTHQSFTARELFRTAFKSPPPAMPLGLLYVLSLSYNTQNLGTLNGLIVSLGASVAIYVFVSGFGWIFKKSDALNPVSFFFTGTIIPSLIVFTGFSLVDPLSDARWVALVIMPIWYGQTALVFAMGTEAIKSAAANRREVKEISSTEGDAALTMLRRKRKQLANQMHGEVQSRLMGLVLRAEAGAQLDTEFVVSELEAIERLLADVAQQEGELEGWIEQLISTWQGFARIETDLSGLEVTQASQDLVFALLEEGVSNAIRHGLATEVLIQSQGPAVLVVEDNGIGPTRGKPGLGTKLLETGSASWSLTGLEQGGSRLEIELKDA